MGDNSLFEHDWSRRFRWTSLRAGLAGLALAGMLFAAACGGDDDDDTSSEPGDAAGATSASPGQTTAPSASAPADEPEESEETEETRESGGVRGPLEAGSSLEIDAPDAGNVKMTILEIRSPADDLLAAGLTADPGQQLWAVKATVDVNGGEESAIADFTVTTTDGNAYGWTGTASDNDLGYLFALGTTKEGFVAFQIPEGQDVKTLTVLFSIYEGYDMTFES